MSSIEAMLICLAYGALLLGLSKVFGVPYTRILDTSRTIARGIIFPVVISTAVLLLYLVLRGELSASFTAVPASGQWFMWIPLCIIAVGIGWRLIHFNKAKYTRTSIILLIIATVLVGFSEELLTRGFLASVLFDNSYSLLATVLISSALFGLLHGINYFNGQEAKLTLVQMTLTTLLGINLFAIMLATGQLWVAMAFHAAYDLSAIGMSDEINVARKDIAPSKIDGIISLATYLSAVGVVIGLLFVG